MNQKKTIQVLIGVVVVLAVVLILDNASNRGTIRKLQNDKNTERKKSKKVVDSLKKIIKLDSLTLIKRLDSVTLEANELKAKYEKSLKKQKQLENDISNYLHSTDSMRFAKFKELITEVD